MEEAVNGTAEAWRERIGAQQASGRSIRAWCRENGCAAGVLLVAASAAAVASRCRSHWKAAWTASQGDWVRGGGRRSHGIRPHSALPGQWA